MKSVLLFRIGKEVKWMQLLQNTHTHTQTHSLTHTQRHNTFAEAINNRYPSHRF